VEDAQGRKLVTLNGTWDGCIFRQDDPQAPPVPVWQSSPPARDPTRYNLTAWAITLNELTDTLAPLLPKTDSRLRPDQKHLEQVCFLGILGVAPRRQRFWLLKLASHACAPNAMAC